MVSIRKIAASTKLGLTGIALVVGVLGCGSSTTNNDQGASFSALGFFTAATPEPPPGLSGLNATLSQDSAASGFASQSLAYIGLENRLTNSFIRVTKIDCDYNVPAATIPIPSDSISTSGFINASPSIGGPTIGGSGTATATGTGTRLYLQFQLISPSIYAYLNSNRNALPELPFQVQILCTATGITNAGKTFETNPVGLTAVMIEQSFVNSTGGTGTGTGGNVTGFDGSDSSNTGDGTTTVGAGGSGATVPGAEVIPVVN